MRHHGARVAAMVALSAAAALGGCGGPRWHGDPGPGDGPRVGWGGGYAAGGGDRPPPSHRAPPEPWTWQRQRDEWRQQERPRSPR